jgi:hypothetical protein
MTTCSDSVENPIVTAGGKTDSGATTTRSRIGENHYGTQFSQRLASSFVNLRQELSAFLVTVGRKLREAVFPAVPAQTAATPPP